MKNTRKILTALTTLTLTGMISACGADHNFDSGDKIDASVLAISGESDGLLAGTRTLTEAAFNANVKPHLTASCDRCHSAPTFAQVVALSVLGDPANSPIYQRATGALHHRVVWKTSSPEATALATWIMGQ